MSMARSNRRNGLTFLLIGLLGALFFWISDPRFGPQASSHMSNRLDWHYWVFILRGSPDNVVDAANQALLSTAVGIAGCAALVLVGFWLLSRRAV
jgi:hypothetical protein